MTIGNREFRKEIIIAKCKRGGTTMGTKEHTQDTAETIAYDLPQDSFQLTDHPWLAEDVAVEDEIRYALDEIRL